MDTERDSWKPVSKKVFRKTGEFLGNKIEVVLTKSNDDNIVKQEEPVEEIIISPEARDEIFKKFRKVV